MKHALNARARKRKDIPERCLVDVVRNLGGTLININTQPLSMPNSGCGSPTHVAGTNGGMMSCGAMLTDLAGNTAPYYCGVCDVTRGLRQGREL